MSALRDQYKASDPSFGDAPPAWIKNVNPSASLNQDKILIGLNLGSFYSRKLGWMQDVRELLSTAASSSIMTELFGEPVLSFNQKSLSMSVSSELSSSVNNATILQIITGILYAAESKGKIAIPAYATIQVYGNSIKIGM
jgi:hypothetical protein